MRAYTIFIFLLLFGLCTSTIDSMAMTEQNIESQEMTASIQEVTNMTTAIQEEIQSEENWLIYAIKIAVKITTIILNALLYTITCIPLFLKYNVPIEIIAICQTMQSVVLGIGIASWITQRSTKSID